MNMAVKKLTVDKVGITEKDNRWAKCKYCKKGVDGFSPTPSLSFSHASCSKKNAPKGSDIFTGRVRRGVSRLDAERVIQEVGVTTLSSSISGQRILEKARKKYAKELLQPSDPAFYREYGKEIRERNEARMAAVERSKREWGDNPQSYHNRHED